MEDRPIAKGRFSSRQDNAGKQLRINERIRISPIRLIDQDNNQVGIVEIQRALDMARSADLDLVEVAPNSRPPVCRIMDYGKWKYQQKKRDTKSKSHAKQNKPKELRLRPKTDDHDMKLKVDRAYGFLVDGHKVQMTMMFRGREMAHQDIGYNILMDTAKALEDVSKIDVEPRRMGRRMTMVLSPTGKPGKKKKADGPAEGNADQSGTPQSASEND